MKKCPRCKEYKLLDLFPKNKSSKDGLNKYCKECSNMFSRKAYAENPTKKAEQLKIWRKNNPDKVKAQRKSNYIRHIEKRRSRGREYGKTLRARFSCGRIAARKRNLEWSITREEHAELLALPCYYCKGPLNISGSGLDRKNNDLGYTKENVVSCCYKCNGGKGKHFTSEEFLVMMTALVEYKRKLNP